MTLCDVLCVIWICFIAYWIESFCFVVVDYLDEAIKVQRERSSSWTLAVRFPFVSFEINPNDAALSRFRGIPFSLPVGWQQRLEPRLSGHLPLEASEGPQRHPDGGTPALLCIAWAQPRSAVSADPSYAHPHLVPQPRTPEKTATLCQVGKQSVHCP